MGRVAGRTHNIASTLMLSLQQLRHVVEQIQQQLVRVLRWQSRPD